MEGYRRILLASDFSDHSALAARRAVELAERYDAELTLLHVVDYFPEDVPIDWIAPEDVDPTEFLVNRSRESLAQLASRIGRKDAAQEVALSSHSAKHEIIRFAKKKKMDLIVVGSHGRHRAGAVLGATAERVLQDAPCDVLTVRAHR